MASIRIERWKQVYSSDPANKFVVPPEHHPYAWLIPRWWYQGSRTIYQNCVKIQGTNYQMYVESYSPAMAFECEVNDDLELSIIEARDIRRIAITENYAELLKPDGEYLDIDMEWSRDTWKVVKNDLPPAVPIDVPVVWVSLPSITPPCVIGSTFSGQTGNFTGGMNAANGNTPFLRYRWQVRDEAGSIFNSGWSVIDPSSTVTLDPVQVEGFWPADYKDIRLHSQVRDYEPGTNTQRPNNKFSNWTAINEALVVQTAASLDAGNVYEPTNTLTGTTATFEGGVAPITYQYRWQAGVDLVKVESKDGGSFNSPWQTTTNGGAASVGYIVGDVQTYVRLQSQAIDAAGTVVDSFTATQAITLPPPSAP